MDVVARRRRCGATPTAPRSTVNEVQREIIALAGLGMPRTPRVRRREDVPVPGAGAAEHARGPAAQVDFVYRSALKGYSAVIPNDRVAAVRGDSRVAYVEPDQTAVASAQVLPWGIDKIDADVSSTHACDGSGAISNVNVYVIDSGVSTTHPDPFVATHGKFTRGLHTDRNGHG